MMKKTALFLATIALIGLANAQTPLTPPTLIASTDRQIYRQGEKVTIAIEALDDELKPSPNTQILLTITDPNLEIIADIGLRTDTNGTATYELQLEKNAPEGEYVVEVSDEANIHRPAIVYFTVCNTCKRTEPAKTVTVETTATQYQTTVATTTASTTLTQTTTVTEQILTSETLLTAIFAIIVAIFIFQLIASRKIFTHQD
ncbi:MAG: MG2 domain-containing protein [Candidatus Caldarchaeum sp.]|uniref:Macroglobulin domain-containing protein n=1 Tax=Caldiarchaeum subterraneum TaxID=311458 RepID=E6NAI1_CALS0|nr:hypothetical protein HGMM_F01D06C04 [Candidatus Caldarchaeum subterraneum]